MGGGLGLETEMGLEWEAAEEEVAGVEEDVAQPLRQGRVCLSRLGANCRSSLGFCRSASIA